MEMILTSAWQILFAMTCLTEQKTVEGTITKLMEVARMLARERPAGWRIPSITVENAAAAVAGNWGHGRVWCLKTPSRPAETALTSRGAGGGISIKDPRADLLPWLRGSWNQC
jgi:hypothetical protein